MLYLNSTHSCSLLVIDVNDDMNNDWYSCGFNDHKYWGRLRIARMFNAIEMNFLQTNPLTKIKVIIYNNIIVFIKSKIVKLNTTQL